MPACFLKKVCSSRLIKPILLLVAVATFGCAQIRINENVEGLKRIDKGQSLEDVFKAMGTPVVQEEISARRIIAYYQTMKGESSESTVTTALCTPIAFEDKRVAGIGYDIYEQWVYEERERQRQFEIYQARRREAQMAEAARQQIMEERREKIADLEKDVAPVPASNAALNLKLYRQLLALDPGNAQYQKKVLYYEKRLTRQREAQKARAKQKAKERFRQAWERNRDTRNKILGLYAGNGTAEMAVYDMGNNSLYVWVKNVSQQIITTHPDYFTLIDSNKNAIPCAVGDSLDRVLEPGNLSHGEIEFSSDRIPNELIFQNRETGRISKLFQ